MQIEVTGFMLPLESGFFITRAYDLANCLICIFSIFFIGSQTGVRKKHLFCLMLHAIVPLFLYGVLIDYSYMPDGLKYWQAINKIRWGEAGVADAFLNYSEIGYSSTVASAAGFFTIIPLPSTFTANSLSFFSVYIYILLFFYLYIKKLFTRFSVWFYLFYPSLFLYSSLPLRDMLILFFMVFIVQLSREKKWIVCFLMLMLLFLIKMQNVVILLPLCIYYFLLRKKSNDRSSNSRFTFVKIIPLILFLSIPFSLLFDFFIPIINNFRLAMFIENGGEEGSISTITSMQNLFFEGTQGFLNFSLSPFPWQAGNAFQLIQSVENLIILFLFFLMFKLAFSRNAKQSYIWLLFLFFSFSIYGLVVFNYGTAARYRFPFVLITVVFLSHEANIDKVFNFRRSTPKKPKVSLRTFN